MTLPDTLRIMYTDGAMSTDYLVNCNADQVATLAPAQVAAAEFIPHENRQAYFCAIAGAVSTRIEPPTAVPVAERIEADATANPETIGDANPPMGLTDADKRFERQLAAVLADTPAEAGTRKRWPLQLQEEARVLVTRVIAKPDMTAEGIQWDAEVVAFAARANTTAAEVIAKAVGRGVVLPVPSAVLAVLAEDLDNVILGPGNWAAILPDGSTHRVDASCCRWFVVRTSEGADLAVADVARTKAEAEARIPVLSPRYPGSAWSVVEASQTLAAELDAPPPVEAVPLPLVDMDTALLVPAEPVGTVADAFAYTAIAPPPAVEAEPLAALMVPAEQPAEAPSLAALMTDRPAEPVAVEVPLYSWEQFIADVQETVIAEGQTDGRFVIDSVDRLGWFVRKLAGIDGELAALDASYQTARRAITSRRSSYERYFTPQAQAFAAAELERLGKGKTLNVLGGNVAFRAVDDRLDKLDGDAALAWARTNLPGAITQKVTESVAAKAVEQHWRTTGEVPAGYDVVPAHESFSVTPAKPGKEQ